MDGNNDWEIDAPELDEWRMRQLRSNDPMLTSLDATWKRGSFLNDVDWSMEGRFIRESTHLKRVKIDFCEEDNSTWRDLEIHLEIDLEDIEDDYLLEDVRENYVSFFQALAMNRSIEHLQVRLVPSKFVPGALYHFVRENPKLRVLDIMISGELVGKLAAAISMRCNGEESLQRFRLAGTCVRGQGAGKLIAALSSQSNLEELNLVAPHDADQSCFMEQSVWVALRKLVQNSASLSLLNLEGVRASIDDDCVKMLTAGLRGNRTLRKISLRRESGGGAFGMMLTQRGWKSLLVALGSHPTISELDFERTNIDDEGALLLAEMLVSIPTLKVLRLDSCRDISSAGWRAFFGHLQNSMPLALEHFSAKHNTIDDEAISAMVATPSKLTSLKHVQLRGNLEITSIGRKALAGLLKNPGYSLRGQLLLESLDISLGYLCHRGAAAIGSALATNTSLKRLVMMSNDAGQSGWRSFAAGVSQNRSLVELDLEGCDIADVGMAAISNGLKNNKSLRTLNLSRNHQQSDLYVGGVSNPISAEGWAVFGECLPNSALADLNLNHTEIDDTAVVALVGGMANMTSLQRLVLSDNHRVSSAGWRRFADVLRNPNTSLVHADLQGNSIDDGVAAEFAVALTGNQTVEELFFTYVSLSRAAVVQAFSPLLCNTSNISSILASNHTLKNLGDSLDCSYLRLNELSQKHVVAREKIFYSFRNGSGNLRDFLGIDLAVIPRLLALMAGDSHLLSGQSLLFRLLKSMPTLVAPSIETESAGTKRKRS